MAMTLVRRSIGNTDSTWRQLDDEPVARRGYRIIGDRGEYLSRHPVLDDQLFVVAR